MPWKINPPSAGPIHWRWYDAAFWREIKQTCDTLDRYEAADKARNAEKAREAA